MARHFRQKANLTQGELADKIGVTLKTVYRWEKGEGGPNAADIRKLCSVLHCTEAELLNGPAKQEWKLELVHDLRGAIEVNSNKPIVYLSVQPDGMSVTLAGGIDLWKDDDAFEDFITQLREKRAMGLRNYSEGWA